MPLLAKPAIEATYIILLYLVERLQKLEHRKWENKRRKSNLMTKKSQQFCLQLLLLVFIEIPCCSFMANLHHTNNTHDFSKKSNATPNKIRSSPKDTNLSKIQFDSGGTSCTFRLSDILKKATAGYFPISCFWRFGPNQSTYVQTSRPTYKTS